MRIFTLCLLLSLGALAAESPAQTAAQQPAPRASTLRRAGAWTLAGAGIMFVGSATFAMLGVHTNSWIRSGAPSTADYIAMRDSGRTYNKLAWASLAAGGVLLAAGMPMFILGGKTSAPQAAVGVTPAGAFAVVRFP
jgi:invasion protein IalB